MTDTAYSTRLRKLSKDYFQTHIGFDDYRAQRKIVLDEIDAEFNGRRQTDEDSVDQEQAGFMRTIAFFKDGDVED